MEGCKVLLQSVPANIKACMWFQHDGAPAHFSADVRSALDTAYPGRCIGRDGPGNWSAHSPDLSCLDFLWSHMKSLVNASPVDSDVSLVARIAVVAGEIQEMLGVFANVRHSLRRWCEACIFAGGCFFEQFLRFRKKIYACSIFYVSSFIHTHHVRTSNCFFLF
ncbi:uncharacterized protein TNCV_212381 [Trichonephila clavipes]|nr:uncharacterized protein TNCV_212381 [Trichonephila clavipes]